MFLGRVVQPGEPLWTGEDRAWALALLAEEGDECAGCGQPRADAYGPEAEGRYTAKVVTCMACLAAEFKGEHDAQGRGDKVQIIRKPGR